MGVSSFSYRSIESILKKGLDKQPLPQPLPEAPVLRHDNVRGPAYDHQPEEISDAQASYLG